MSEANLKLEEVYILDNFFDNPDVIRKLALEASYCDHKGKANFAGMESKRGFYNEKIISKFEKILNTRISPDPTKLAFGKFRYSVLKDEARTKVHFDKVDWAAIIYLTPNNLVSGGLDFYNLRELDLDKVPSINNLKNFGCLNLIEFDQKYVMKYTNDQTKWKLINHIPAQYNRLVLFKGTQYFHSVSEQFGNDIHDARLTQVFFFNESGDE